MRKMKVCMTEKSLHRKMTARLFGNMAFGIVYSMNFPKWVKKSVNMTDRLLGKSRLVAW